MQTTLEKVKFYIIKRHEWADIPDLGGTGFPVDPIYISYEEIPLAKTLRDEMKGSSERDPKFRCNGCDVVLEENRISVSPCPAIRLEAFGPTPEWWGSDMAVIQNGAISPVPKWKREFNFPFLLETLSSKKTINCLSQGNMKRIKTHDDVTLAASGDCLGYYYNRDTWGRILSLDADTYTRDANIVKYVITADEVYSLPIFRNKKICEYATPEEEKAICKNLGVSFIPREYMGEDSLHKALRKATNNGVPQRAGLPTWGYAYSYMKGVIESLQKVMDKYAFDIVSHSVEECFSWDTESANSVQSFIGIMNENGYDAAAPSENSEPSFNLIFGDKENLLISIYMCLEDSTELGGALTWLPDYKKGNAKALCNQHGGPALKFPVLMSDQGFNYLMFKWFQYYLILEDIPVALKFYQE